MHSLEVIKQRNNQIECYAASVAAHLGLDGGVRGHSAGPLFPFYVVTRECWIGDVQDEHLCIRDYSVEGPGIDNELPNRVIFTDVDDAYHAARRLRVMIENEDAWAAAIERACTSGSVGGMSINAVVGALRKWHDDVGIPERWADQTQSQRARTILVAWAARCIFAPGMVDTNERAILKRILG